jgi:DNA-binding beta-propeller fold protein YncE
MRCASPVVVVLVAVAVCASVTIALGQSATLDFEKDEIGKSPTGFAFALTGQGKPGVWIVKKDDQAHGKVLVQTDADTTDYRFPVAVYDRFSAKDVDVSVRFKALSGRGDQGAGIVWRYRDQNNYYITRCNALEDNCTIYDVVNGRRQAFLNQNVKVASNVWHTLRVEAMADHFVVTFDGKNVLDVKDGTFKDPGKVGLWTKADSVIAFDDFSMAIVPGSVQSSSGQEPLSLVRTIDLPRVEGRIDHLAIDMAAQRLFVAALGNNTVEVVDLRNNIVVKSVAGFHEPQGLQVVPDAKSVAVANGQSGNLQWLDGTDYHLTRTTPLGDDADNVRYDTAAKRVYVGYGSGAIAAIGLADGKVLGEAKVAGHPESFQLERSGPRMFVNVPAADQIAVVDRGAMKVLATWPVVNARANFPMALDEVNHRLFIGCRRPAKVLVYDTTSGQQVSAFDIAGDTDDLFYDAARKRLYVSGGEGFIDVFQQQDGNRFGRIAHVATAAGARTSLFVSEQNRLYLAVPHRGAQKAEIRVYEPR